MYLLKDVYKNVYTQLLNNHKIVSNHVEADVILCKVLGVDKVYLYTDPYSVLTPQQVENVNKFLYQRLSGKPLAYIFNEREFYGINFYVDENVFIPRQETELLVEETIKLIKQYQFKTCADIGTGCGNIAISIVKNIKDTIIMFATDISTNVLEVAKKNAKLLSVGDKINFILSDKLEYFIKNFITVDLIVSNPPYVTEEEYQNLQTEIYFEPKNALVAACDGLEFYEHFAIYGRQVLNKNGYLLVELNPSLVDRIVNIFQQNNYKIIKVVKDYQNLPRVLIVKKE